MAKDIKIVVGVKQRRISWRIWAFVTGLCGWDSFISQCLWWFLEPLLIDVAGTGWEPVKYELIMEALA